MKQPLAIRRSGAGHARDRKQRVAGMARSAATDAPR